MKDFDDIKMHGAMINIVETLLWYILVCYFYYFISLHSLGT